jgi:bifunctional ADP-heptose synthase (sugar kinase/adenylyltransferase)
MHVESLDKQLPLDEYLALREQMKKEQLCLVQVHGVFDVLHPVTVRLLQEARSMGDRLLVTIPPDDDVELGPGRPVFPAEMRAQALAGLAVVDHVVVVGSRSPADAIEVIRPDVYCRQVGPDDDAVLVNREEEAVRRAGGRPQLLERMDFSGTQLLEREFSSIPSPARGFLDQLLESHDLGDVLGYVDAMSDLRVLVVGEVIIDEYITCESQGTTIKDRVPSVRWISSERHWGGAYAIARHMSGFCGRVALGGLAAPGEDVLNEHSDRLPGRVERHFEADPGARTIVKQRFVLENQMRPELDKVFSVKHMLEPAAVSDASRARLRDRLHDLMSEVDLVVVADYGHGLIDPETRDMLQQEAPFLALNCQTNSSNFGYHPITTYSRAETFALDEVELSLALHDQSREWERLLPRARELFGSEVAWLTLGSRGCLAATRSDGLVEAPALTLHVRDTLGAGDAFFSLGSLAARLGAPVRIGSFLGNVAGAMAVSVAGNAEPVEKAPLTGFVRTLLDR